ncbi:MAG TPA: hypothetical protein PLR25_24730, partial [Planctomycetaceae bacterium]|nr:hypothetical protein [Planctomycetaceae bacterium]
LRQYRGTQFSFGGAWADADYGLNQKTPLPSVGVTPFNSTSNQPGAMLGNIGVTQDLTEAGIPATLGVALISNAGLGVDFRGVPASNGTSAQLLALDMVTAAGFDVTDDLSVGASFQLGTSYLDGPFTGIGGMSTAYGARGTLGANYFVAPDTSIGVYWQSKQHFTFNDAIVYSPAATFDVNMDLPSNVGFGVANSSLMDGNLLLAADLLYKQWSQTDLFWQIYDDQWTCQFGAQYALTPQMKLRMGYAYNQNPMKSPGATTVGGIVLPEGVPGMRYIQGQFAAITQNRVTIGLGVQDVLLPGIDLDMFAGYAFGNSDSFATTDVTISDNYWIGGGLTWRFGAARCACAERPAERY